MPTSTLASRRDSPFDILLELRPYTAASLAATTSGIGIALTAYAHAEFSVVLGVLAQTGYVASTAQWTISVEASTVLASGYVAVSSVTLVGLTATRHIALSGDMINEVVPNARFLRVTATKLGTVGNLTYGAFISPDMQ